jgi:hypothetical protein
VLSDLGGKQGLLIATGEKVGVLIDGFGIRIEYSRIQVFLSFVFIVFIRFCNSLAHLQQRVDIHVDITGVFLCVIST